MKLNTKTLMLVLAIGLLSSYSTIAKDEGKEASEKNILTNIYGLPRVDRSSFVSVEAYYFPDRTELELICYDIKETTICIVSQLGDIVFSDTFDFTLSPYLSIATPFEKGMYWLVLDSAEIYAEGIFYIN